MVVLKQEVLTKFSSNVKLFYLVIMCLILQ